MYQRQTIKHRPPREKDMPGQVFYDSSFWLRKRIQHKKRKSKEEITEITEPKEQETKKNVNLLQRIFFGGVMIGGFAVIISSGHFWVIMLILGLQMLVFKELIAIAHVPYKEKKLPWFRTITWYFLFCTLYFLYGESLIYYFKDIVFVNAFLLPFAVHHRFISFVWYVLGIVLFVLNLKKGHYRFQFSQFAFTHMILLLVVFQSQFIINNIFEGLFWLLLPVSLVVSNDIFAYFFGKAFGRTPLIELSPKKTLEGFLGSMVVTLLLGFFFPRFLMKFPYLICPVKHLTMFQHVCEPDVAFIPVPFSLFPFVSTFVRFITGWDITVISIAPIQWHGLVLAVFASLIAPFGGFFASGLKRAFKIKDFSDSIPGHGGFADRFDCELIMGGFSYLYLHSFIKINRTSVGHVLQLAVQGLTVTEQLELHYKFLDYLKGQGITQ